MNKSVNKVVCNAMWIIGCKIVQSILVLVINMLTARYLGPANFGVINYAASIVAFAVPIMQLGINSVLVHDLVLHPQDEGSILGTTLVLNLISGALCMGGIVAFAAVANAGETVTIIVCALYSIQLLALAVENITYWFQAKLLSKYTSVISVIAYVIVSVYKLYLLVTRKSVYWFSVANSIDYMLIAFLLYGIYRKQGGQQYAFSSVIAKRLMSTGKYYILANMMVTIFAQTDKIMLKTMIGDTATGYYAAAVACAGMTGFVFSAIIDSMRPVILGNKQNNDDTYESHVVILYSIVIILALLQSIVITFGAQPIIKILYGEAYLPAKSALRIIVWYTTFSYIGSVRNIWLLAERKQNLLWKINLCGAAANVIMNALLIPQWGINGAAFASLATQVFTNVILGWIVPKLRRNNVLMCKALNPRPLIGFMKRLV